MDLSHKEKPPELGALNSEDFSAYIFINDIFEGLQIVGQIDTLDSVLNCLMIFGSILFDKKLVVFQTHGSIV